MTTQKNYTTKTQHYTARTLDEAWKIADSIFPTDYMKDEERSQRAGYPTYGSTAEGHYYDYICDLNTRLEVNLSDGRTVNIMIQHRPEWGKGPDEWDYNGQY